MCRILVNLAELKSACKRLLATIDDECDVGTESVRFTTDRDSLHIETLRSSETVLARVLERGQKSVPCALLRNMALTLRFYRKRKIDIAVSDGELRIERMAFRNPLPN
jgi:hypothetical protein